MFIPSLHVRTPSLSAMDPRGLPVLSVAYHCDEPDTPVEARSTRREYDAAGGLCAQWDARLWSDGGEAGEPNQSAAYSLTGQALRTTSVDAGWAIVLPDDAGQMVQDWDGRGTHRWFAYDAQHRPLSVSEQMEAGLRRCVDRFTYGGADASATNRCGRIVRHEDTAGRREVAACDLGGVTLALIQRFRADLETPDWPEATADRDTLLETDAQGAAIAYTT